MREALQAMDASRALFSARNVPGACAADGLVPPPSPAPASGPADRATLGDSLETSWGFKNENAYNGLIISALAEKWQKEPPLPPMLLKSTVAQESGFDPKCVSKSGYVGLLQLGTEEALAQGLKLQPVDERTIAEKNLPAGVAVLAFKHHVVTHPIPQWDTDWGRKVDAYYKDHGLPSPDQQFALALGAYNGGGGTVLRAMAKAIDAEAQGSKLDPRSWSTLLEPKDDPKKSPLFQACREIYGDTGAPSKFKEMSRYPVMIFARIGQTAP